MRRGQKHTELAKQRIREARAKQLPPRLGAEISEITRQRIAKANKGRVPWNQGLTKATDSRVQVASESMRKPHKPLSLATRRRMSQSKKGVRHSEERKRRMSETRKQLWRDPSYVRKQLQSQIQSPNVCEKYLQQILDDHFPGQWKFVGDGQLIVGGKCPDFVHTERKLLIELFGDYWHSEHVTGVPEEQHVQERVQLFEAEGYQTLVIWEHELEDTFAIIHKIQEDIL